MGVEILDYNLRLVADLGNAANVGYEINLNDVSTASFSLPFGDSKNKYCKPRQGYVRIEDGDEHIGLFRIGRKPTDHGGSNMITYECQHVITTLADTVMERYHHYGGIGYYTRQVLEYILSQQKTKRWVLGRCAFSRQFEYEVNDENLLFALFDVPRTFTSYYKWVYDTTVYPWVLHLDELDTAVKPECYCSYGKNLDAITKTEDPTQLTTRLYCYGYGEGVNQLTIERVNPTKKLYIDAPPEVMADYGDPVESVFTDRRFTVEESLYERGVTLLEQLRRPRIEYQINMADLEPMTGNALDKPWPGKVIRVEDEELGEDVKTFITQISKSDIFRDKLRISVTLANQPEDIASMLSSIADRQKIEALYSQGSTSFCYAIAERDAGKTFPLVLPLYIPSVARTVNGVFLQIWLDSYVMMATTTESGGGSSQTSKSGGGGQKTSGPSSITSTGSTSPQGQVVEIINTGEQQGTGAAHTHPIRFGASANPVPNHTHGMIHTHDITLDQHQHGVEIPAHAHGNKPGISRGPRASQVTVQVESGQTIPWPAGTGSMDITRYLYDSNGLIPRDRYINIIITPQADANNPEGLAWIRAVATPVSFCGADYGGRH